MKNETHNKIQISLLGNFEIKNQDIKISETINRSKKMWNLLGFILTYRHKHISQDEYIKMLWPNESSSNPTNALKTLLSRLRTLLEPVAVNNENFILSSQGSYQWNNNLSCLIDTEVFEEYVKKGNNPDMSESQRISYYMEALQLYKGDFLARHSSEIWVAPVAAHFHNLYLDAAKSLLQLLQKQNDYENMEYYCTKALQISHYDETLHAFLIRTFLGQGNTLAALNHYEQTTKLLYQNLGIKPSKELRALYMDIIRTQKTLETDLSMIHNDLKEAEYKKGPFICEYCIFQETYRLIARQAVRAGRPVYLCLITLSDRNGNIPSLNQLDASMKRLLDAINKSLRRDDVVSQYNGAQYVILLPAITYEDATMVLERIIKQYYQNNKRSILHLNYKLEQIFLEKNE